MDVNKPEALSKSNLHKSPHLIITMAICLRNVDWRGSVQSKYWSESIEVIQRIVNIIHISLKMRKRPWGHLFEPDLLHLSPHPQNTQRQVLRSYDHFQKTVSMVGLL